MSPLSKYVLIFSICWLFSALPLFFFSCSSFSSLILSPYSAPKKKPVHLLVVSSWRSGSSFLGQIFNHHDDVFYLFEPGHAIWMKFQNESSELLHYPLRDLLRSLFTCDVSPLQHYLHGEYFSQMGFFGESRALCRPPACGALKPSKDHDRLGCYFQCRNTLLGKLADACKIYSHVVMKTVRILDLSVLLPLFRDPALDLHVVHLVRDPRAVALSRTLVALPISNQIMFKNEGNKNITLSKVMEKICKAQVDINGVAKAAEALEGRYMAIRHEDLAYEPFRNVKKIYNFAGLYLTEDLEEWVHNITHVEDANSKLMIFSRDSSMVVQRWRTALDFDVVKQVQENCREAMELFGYRPANSRAEQRDLTLSLVNKEWSSE